MKINVQTQTLDFHPNQLQTDQAFSSKNEQISNNTERKSEYNSKKDIHLSDLDPDLPALEPHKDLITLPQLEPRPENRETIKQERRRVSTKEASVSANFQPELRFPKSTTQKSHTEAKDSNREVAPNSSMAGVGFDESSDLLYSCVAAYAHNMFSRGQHDKEQSVIMRKCLEQGKLNFPDLFLRFID